MKPNELSHPSTKRGEAYSIFLLSSLENFHDVHFDLFGDMDVYMFIFMVGFVYIGPQNGLLY